MSEIGKKLIALRADRGWDQTDLAENSGLSISTISRIETGKKLPNLDQKVALARAFAVPLSVIDVGLTQDNVDMRLIAGLPAKEPVSGQPGRPAGHIPLYIQNSAGTMGEFMLADAMVSEIVCPPNLAGVPGAFAIQIPDMLMAPRFRAGETIFIHPKAPIRRDDDVVIFDAADTADSCVYAGQYRGVVQAEIEGDPEKQTEPCFVIFQIGRNEEIEVPTQGAKIMKIVGVLYP